MKPREASAAEKARAWSAGKATGAASYYVEGVPQHSVTAQARRGTEIKAEMPEQGERSPERKLAAAVLLSAVEDASGKPRYPAAGKTYQSAVWFLTKRLPSPWAKRRQLFTALLGLDDDEFRTQAARKLGLE